MATITPVKAGKPTNFKSKSERKRVRKGLVRAAISNKVTDAKMTSEDRIRFYRTLREKKLRRRELALEMHRLHELLEDLHRVTRRQTQRHPCTQHVAEDAVEATGNVRSKTNAVADDYQRLSRQKIYFGEAERAA